MKNSSSKIILAVILGIILFLVVKNNLNKKDDTEQIFSYTNYYKEVDYIYDNNGIPKFIDGKFSDQNVNSKVDALNVLDSVKDKFNIKETSEELLLVSEMSSENIKYYKFQQVYDKLPVLYNKLTLMVNSSGEVIGLSGYFTPNINVDTKPTKSEDEIRDVICNNLGVNSYITNIELSIYVDGENYSLVYHAYGYSDSKVREYIVDALNGNILLEGNMLKSLIYTDRGLNYTDYTINVEPNNDSILKYGFYDKDRNITINSYRNIGSISNSFKNNGYLEFAVNNGKIISNYQNKNDIENAVTALGNMSIIYDFYEDVLGIKSYNNNGGRIITNIDYYDNSAYYNLLNNQLFIGSDSKGSYVASLDVLAHEYSHGVINNIVGFATGLKSSDKSKAFEAGALNEAYSDILGTLIEGENWLMADMNTVLRNLADPNSYSYPILKGGNYYYPNDMLSLTRTYNGCSGVGFCDNGGEHINSSIISYSAYLMYKNNAFKDANQMAKVWFNSLFMLSPYSTFEDCAIAVIKSAKNFELDDSKINVIIDSFIETRVLEGNTSKIKGNISSGNVLLDKVNIKVYSYKDNLQVSSTMSDKNGNYDLELSSGTYIFEYTKDNYRKYEKVLFVNGDKELNVTLANIEYGVPSINLSCTTDNCHKFSIYFLEGLDIDSAKEKYRTFSIDDGTILDIYSIVDIFNDGIGSNILSTNGMSIYMSAGGFNVEYTAFYKDTDIKYKWNSPIKEDMAIEIRLFDSKSTSDKGEGMNNLLEW